MEWSRDDPLRVMTLKTTAYYPSPQVDPPRTRAFKAPRPKHRSHLKPARSEQYPEVRSTRAKPAVLDLPDLSYEGIRTVDPSRSGPATDTSTTNVTPAAPASFIMPPHRTVFDITDLFEGTHTIESSRSSPATDASSATVTPTAPLSPAPRKAAPDTVETLDMVLTYRFVDVLIGILNRFDADDPRKAEVVKHNAVIKELGETWLDMHLARIMQQDKQVSKREAQLEDLNAELARREQELTDRELDLVCRETECSLNMLQVEIAIGQHVMSQKKSGSEIDNGYPDVRAAVKEYSSAQARKTKRLHRTQGGRVEKAPAASGASWINMATEKLASWIGSQLEE
jgi:hypothetical protein